MYSRVCQIEPKCMIFNRSKTWLFTSKLKLCELIFILKYLGFSFFRGTNEFHN